MGRTKVDEELEVTELTFADDPERANVVARVRRFKASWIELAEALSDVKRGNRYKTWGYDSFEDYAKKELRLKPDTVDKLLGSFTFLRKRAPEVLERDGVARSIPSYQAIDFLRRERDVVQLGSDGTTAIPTTSAIVSISVRLAQHRVRAQDAFLVGQPLLHESSAPLLA